MPRSPIGKDIPETLLRTWIVTGQSGARVERVQQRDGSCFIEKTGPAGELALEGAVLRWCCGRLPVARLLATAPGLLRTTELPGVSLADISRSAAAKIFAEALTLIHSVSLQDCPFAAGWELRLEQAERRLEAGLVDESDFDKVNRGRSGHDLLSELHNFPPLPKLRCFTHGDATLQNFFTHQDRLSGIVDLGRAGAAHPAQDWALALRSMRDRFGDRGEEELRVHIPQHSAIGSLLRRFQLLDEFF